MQAKLFNLSIYHAAYFVHVHVFSSAAKSLIIGFIYKNIVLYRNRPLNIIIRLINWTLYVVHVHCIC